MLYVWIAAITIFIVLELLTPQLVCIWFAIGSIGALVAQKLGALEWVQFAVFAGVSLVMLVITRPLYNKGEKKSAILVAEGKKEAAILTAQAEKESAILRAEAIKEATIREAEGKAEAILKVQEATAQGIEKLNEANPTKEVLALKSFDALKEVADGKATKIIIPSEIQGIAGMAASLKGIFENDKPTE